MVARVFLDAAKVRSNVRKFHDLTTGVAVRSHLKAHRTAELARLQVDAGSVGISVHTANAARRLGIPDAVVSWPWRDEWRWPLYARAALELPRFAVHADDAAVIEGIGRAAGQVGSEVGVRLDLRHIADPDVLPLARTAARTSGIRFDGISRYCGPETKEDLRDAFELGRRNAVRLIETAAAIRADGIGCPVVCAGGTPTAAGALAVEGITEITAGAYATLDAGLAAAGYCAPGDVAISVTDPALLDGCSQPWAPETVSMTAGERLLPAHICPLAKRLALESIPITVTEEGESVAVWRPTAWPDGS